MKKKLIIGFATLFVAAAAMLAINLNTNKTDLSALSLANVEALTRAEVEIPYLCILDWEPWCINDPDRGGDKPGKRVY